MNYIELINIFAMQKTALGMSEGYIGHMSGLSQPTVHRILSGKHHKAAWNDLVAIGKVIGVHIDMSGIRVEEPSDMMERQAEKLAQKTVSAMNATSQLEGQGINPKKREEFIKNVKRQLLTGHLRRLWSEE